jgi:RNA polymerase sigma factor (sigma-70 family)
MASPIDEVEQREREDRNQREVEAILSGLRPEERALATAHWMDGLPTRKIAERQGLPAAKVQERLDRLIRKLRRAGRRARSHEIKGDVEPAPIHPNHLD